MMRALVYQHHFTVTAPLEQVAAFHRQSQNMAAITPPPIWVQTHNAPATLSEGDEMDFTMWIGPLPVRWLARIEGVAPDGFRDQLVRGPFAEWTHAHTFQRIDARSTAVHDHVTARLRAHPLWWPVGLAMWLGLPLLFAYRGWKTRRSLQ